MFGIGAVLVVAAAVVLTLTSGGAFTGFLGAIVVGAAKGTLIGAAIGSVVGAIYSAVTGADLGQSILSGFLIFFGVGAIIGAVAGGFFGGITYNPTFSNGLTKKSIDQGIRKLSKNDIHHIISKSQHDLGKVLSKVNKHSVKSLIRKTLYNGAITKTIPHMQITLKLISGSPTIRGVLVKGIFRIGTFFIM